jgi:hypothetical protein
MLGAAFIGLACFMPSYPKIWFPILITIFVWVLIRLYWKRRVQFIKIQGDLIEVKYGSYLHQTTKFYVLSDLGGELVKVGKVKGKRFYCLKVVFKDKVIYSVDTRDGYHENDLMLISTKLRPAKQIY